MAGYPIKYKQFLFRLTAEDPIILPAYKGSTIRGGFGYAFKRVVCAIKDKECPDCLLKEKCVYSYVFETPPPSDTKIMRKYKTAPHPFVIEPPTERRRGYKPGDEINFGLILIGKAIDYLPYFIYTFDELGRIGIGKGKAKFELRDVSCEGKAIYDSKSKTLKPLKTSSLSLTPHLSLRGKAEAISELGEAISLSFLTPTRIIYDGHLTLDLEFHILIRNLLRRLSLLSYFHCNGDPSEWDFKGIIERAKEVKVSKKDLKWYDWERYSTRQDARMKMGGLIGKIIFEGDIEPFMQLIKAGEVLHVGKGTAFGLGKYEIVKI
ncbi:MAG: CRISPR system precrRNA processing endoribonuclease RAMP protein Cas6 [Thermodesulfovibrionales bacterium]|nr:CRISPR system precrRNA processing endoribonuclease RAMP protein Cas6 [Thermodesulfovibrionales bacterium]